MLQINSLHKNGSRQIKGKGKCHPVTGHEGRSRTGVEEYFYSFLNLGARCGCGQSNALDASAPVKRPGTLWQIRGIINDFTSINGTCTHHLMQDCNASRSLQPSSNQVNRK
jgi:hypothetical protein